MATYAMTINERTTQGKALLAYLSTLNISITPLNGSAIRRGAEPCRFTKEEIRAILAEATEEARMGQHTTHEDFKNEIMSWL